MKKTLFMVFIGMYAIGISAAQGQKPGTCDRACLRGIADQYLAAMVAHDASRAPLARDLKFTENTVALPPTEGLWFTASGLGDFHFYICDVQTSQVAWTGIAKEHDKPVLLSVRLKVANRRITEAESIVLRDMNEKNLGNLKSTPPTFTETLAPSERRSRQEMLRMPDIYFEALDKMSDSAIPWDKDAYRFENGMVTCGTIPGAAPPPQGLPAGRACKTPDGIIPPMLKTIYNVRPRRTPVVDEEMGLTWGLYCFNHRGLATIKMPDGTAQPSYATTPSSMPFADIFKTKNGKLRGIFAIGTMLPYGIGDGWSGPTFK
ncbi:MAG TPA: hypothetical protein VMG30_11570 [Acidobacteriota bacterium]|nr:hypothetical protein [Acidobacteriota bacterium]